jgi:hypothetical protein
MRMPHWGDNYENEQVTNNIALQTPAAPGQQLKLVRVSLPRVLRQPVTQGNLKLPAILATYRKYTDPEGDDVGCRPKFMAVLWAGIFFGGPCGPRWHL